MITANRQKDGESLRLSKIQALRREALTVLYAKLAGENQQVMTFRKLALNDQLLTWEEVPNWINTQREKTKASQTDNPSQYDVSYSTPNVYRGIREVHTVSAPPGGYLEWLARLSEDLASEYTWIKADATVFVLTGNTPPVFNCKVNYTGGYSSLASANRIELVLDLALTEKEVAAIYRQARRSLLKQDKLGKARFRQLSEKHLRLAIFDAEHEGTYLKKKSAWNKQFPKWRYEHLSNFIRDSKKAKQRLLQPDYFERKGAS